MGRESLAQLHFRRKARSAREQREWSQAELAKRLTANGIDAMYASTVAKIEAGEREVKLDEATAIADLFEMSLDELVARDGRRRPEDELTFFLRQLRDNARQRAGQVADLASTIDGDAANVSVGGVPDNIVGDWKEIEDRAASVARDLDRVVYDLGEIADMATEILSRRIQTSDE